MRLDRPPRTRTLCCEMPNLKSPVTTAILSTSLIVLCSGVLSAYEQGTYFIFDLVEKIDAPTAAKRIAADRSIFTESTDKPALAATDKERSEFEIDFGSIAQSGGSIFEKSTGSAFEVDPSASSTSTSDSSTSFDLNSSHSVFDD